MGRGALRVHPAAERAMPLRITALLSLNEKRLACNEKR
jgi:hypothetical protein